MEVDRSRQFQTLLLAADSNLYTICIVVLSALTLMTLVVLLPLAVSEVGLAGLQRFRRHGLNWWVGLRDLLG